MIEDTNMNDTLANDLLQGAGEIARFVYGDDSSRNRRRIYHLIAQKSSCLPVFKMGNQIFARKSSIMRTISALIVCSGTAPYIEYSVGHEDGEAAKSVDRQHALQRQPSRQRKPNRISPCCNRR